MSTITSKGQVTIPKDMRVSLGIEEGDKIAFELSGDSIVLRRLDRKSILDLGGIAAGKAKRTRRGTRG